MKDSAAQTEQDNSLLTLDEVLKAVDGIHFLGT